MTPHVALMLILASLLLNACHPYYLKQPVKPQGQSTSSASGIKPKAIRFEKTDDDMYIVRAPLRRVENAFLSTLVQTYNVNLINNEHHIITTEWDSYYVNSELFRNKVTIKMQALSRRTTRVQIVNNIEKFDKPFTYSVSGKLWVPYDGEESESQRLIEKAALAATLPNSKSDQRMSFFR